MNPYKELVVLVFEKSANDIQSDVVTQQSKYIVDDIEEKFGFQINERTLRNYYNDFIKNNNIQSNVSTSIANYLSKFLGYENFKDFITKKNLEKPKLNKTKKTKEKVVIGSLILLASYFGYDSFTYKCMIWTDNMKYIKVTCEENNAVPLNEDLLNHFQRIKPDCNYKFFKDDGTANLWYGKSINGEYEFFNNLGKHPMTDKTLKEVTNYIIEKYICKESI